MLAPLIPWDRLMVSMESGIFEPADLARLARVWHVDLPGRRKPGCGRPMSPPPPAPLLARGDSVPRHRYALTHGASKSSTGKRGLTHIDAPR